MFKDEAAAVCNTAKGKLNLLEKNPAPGKEADAMAWVRHMNMLKAMAEEVVVREVIYT